MRSDERGAVAVFVAASLTLVIAVAAFAVDLGMQRVVRRDMQALADMVALDLARHLDGRSSTALAAELEQQKKDTIAANASTLGGTPDVTFETGGFTTANTFATSIDPPTAVRVTATGSVDFAFAPGSGSATRTAVSAAVSNACFSVGSFAVGLGRNPSALTALLNPILGDTNLTAVGYQGLANVDVTLLDLIKAPTVNVGSISQLLAANDISVADIMLASAYVLRNESGAANIAQATVLEHLATTVVDAGVNVAVGQIIGLTNAGEGALDATINVLDLVAGAATVANGTNFVGAPALDLNVPNLAGTHQSISIVEAPHVACGQAGATAQTAQIAVNAGGTIGTTVSAPVGGGSITIGGPLTVQAEVGQATGKLGTVTCGPDVVPVTVTTALTSLAVYAPLAISGNDIGISSSIAGVPGLVTADISLVQTVAATPLSRPADPLGSTLTWTIPPDSYGSTKHTGSGSHTLGSASASTTTALEITDIRVAGVPLANVTILGLPIGAVLQTLVIDTVTTVVNGLLGATGAITTAVAGIVTNTVNPTITSLNSVIGSLADVSGLELGGADVQALPSATCNQPVLRG